MYAVVGDSIALGLSQHLRPAAVAAQVGRNSTDGARLIARRREGRLVVSLGTNDDPSNARAFSGNVQRVLRGRRCVVWLTIRHHREFNAVLRSAAHRNPRLHLVAGVADVRTVDRIHPDAKSYTIIAARVRNVLADC